MSFQRIIRRFLTSQNSTKGMGLIEVLVVMAMMILIVLATYSMFGSLRKQQSKQKLIVTFGQLKSQIQNMLSTEIAWRNTVNDPANTEMSCIRNNTNCGSYYALSYATSLPRLNIRSGGPNGGTVFYRSRGSPMSSGFTEDGQACSTFTSAAAGDDSCPIGYVINWRALSATDINPQLVVVAKMIYNPSATHPLRNFFNAGPNSTIVNRYDVEVIRPASTAAKSFTVTVPGPSGSVTAGCTDQGFGACRLSALGWTDFGDGVAAGTYVEVSDPYDLVQITGNRIRVRNPSTLKCQITSYAVGVDGVRLRLSRTNGASPGTLANANSFASNAATTYATVQLNTTVQVTENDTDLLIQQQCDTLPPAALGANSSLCGLGYNTTAGDPNSTRLTVNCSVID